MIREILVVTSTYAARPYTLLVVGEGGGVGLGRGNQVSARRGKEYVIFSSQQIRGCKSTPREIYINTELVLS